MRVATSLASLASVAVTAAFGGLLASAWAHAAPSKPRSEEWWFIAWDKLRLDAEG